MKKLAKKLMIIILSFTFLFGNVSTIFANTNGTTEGGIEYFIENEEVVITGWTIKPQFKDIVIPDYIENYPVVGIEAHAFNEFIIPIESVKLPNTLKWIEHHAFYNQFKLKSIEIPDSVTYIGPYALAKCNSLEEVKLSSSLETIPKSCFSDTAIKKIYIPESVETIESEAFARSEIKYIEFSKGLKKLGDNVFLGCNSLVEVNLPEGLEEIDSSFWSCKSLETVSIPSTVISIGQHTFDNCPNLKTVKLSEGILGIDNNAFTDCENLENINLPNSLLDIGSQNFQNTSIKNIVLPNKLKIITGQLFINCKKLESVEIPDSVTYINEYAFAGCSNLSKVKLNEGLKYIEQAAFKNCTSLKNISLPSTVLSVSWSAFENCSQLEEVKLNNKIDRIYDFTFKNCSSLKEIQIPNSVKSISSGVFLGCTNLEKIVIPKNVTYIADGNGFEEEFAFKDCRNLTIYGYENTAAEEIALKKNMNFVPFTDMNEATVSKISDREYSGTYIKPSTTIKYNGNLLKENVDYTISYSNNKNIGKGNITYNGIGKYTGSKTVNFNIIPQKVKNIKVSNILRTSLTLKWDKITCVDGYYVYKIEENSTKEILVKSIKNTSTEVANLKTGTKYSFKVVPYKKVNDVTYKNLNSPKVNTTTKLSKIENLRVTSPKKGCAHIAWKSVNNATHYEIKMAKSKKGTYSTIKDMKFKDRTALDKHSLSRGKTYYFKMRAYRAVNGKKIYSAYSNVKSIKIK